MRPVAVRLRKYINRGWFTFGMVLKDKCGWRHIRAGILITGFYSNATKINFFMNNNKKLDIQVSRSFKFQVLHLLEQNDVFKEFWQFFLNYLFS